MFLILYNSKLYKIYDMYTYRWCGFERREKHKSILAKMCLLWMQVRKHCYMYLLSDNRSTRYFYHMVVLKSFPCSPNPSYIPFLSRFTEKWQFKWIILSLICLLVLNKTRTALNYIYLTTRITCHSRLTLEKRKEEMGVGAQRKIHFVKLSR